MGPDYEKLTELLPARAADFPHVSGEREKPDTRWRSWVDWKRRCHWTFELAEKMPIIRVTFGMPSDRERKASLFVRGDFGSVSQSCVRPSFLH